MELNIAIQNILNGSSVIIMGAGASFGATNVYGDFPSGSRLAKDLYELCDIDVPDDINDLQDASQCYIEKFSAIQLIAEIRSRLQCASFTKEHEEIYSLPWMRYYTTNYDDVALLAARAKGVSLKPITINLPYRRYVDQDNLCIHINGHIGNLSEATLFSEFKLTSNSYLSSDNITTSQWGGLLNSDLASAKSIFIIGLSLNYDLDLSRILYNPCYKNKTIIIDAPTLTPNAENRLSRFGSVYKLGIDGFANEINKIRSTFIAKPKQPLNKLYYGFIYEYHRKYEASDSTSPNDVFSLFFSGRTSDSLYYSSDEKYEGMICRPLVNNVLRSIEDGKMIIFIHSDMGNGKTICVDQLRFKLSKKDRHVFVLSNSDYSLISEEISDICSVEERVIVIIEDYTNFTDIVNKFSAYSARNIQFVLTARTALNHNKMPEIISKFAIRENQSALFDANKLDDAEINDCISIFDRFGLWGRKSNYDKREKQKYLKARRSGNSMFQSIALDVLKSDVMIKKTDAILKTLKKDSSKYYESVILILLTTAMGIRVSVADIERVAQLDISTDPLFRANPAVNELIRFGEQSQFAVKSSVTAKHILQKIADPNLIVLSLYKLAEYASQYSDMPKYFGILTSIISYTHINSFLRGFQNPELFLLNYYDKINSIEYFRSNHFFWLQYAISCIEIQEFERAQQYIDTAYGLAPEKFEPFQIDNQQARLYLEQIIAGKSKSDLDAFKSAHQILMMPIVSERDNEYNVIRLFGYYCRRQTKSKMIGSEAHQYYKKACKEAYTRLTKFENKYPIYANDLRDLKRALLDAYVN